MLSLFCALYFASSRLTTPFGHQFLQTLIESLHSLALAGLDGRIHLGNFALANQVSDGRRADHDFVRRNTAAADALHQGLRDHRTQALGHHGADHVFFRCREHVDDTVDGLRRRARMQGAEHQVAGFRRRERQANGFQVAHFAHQHDVRIFAQRGTQRLAESQRVAMDFALIDQATFAFMHELDRILDGYNVIRAVVVAVIDHAGECRRLARSGRPGHQHETARAACINL